MTGTPGRPADGRAHAPVRFWSNLTLGAMKKLTAAGARGTNVWKHDELLAAFGGDTPPNVVVIVHQGQAIARTHPAARSHPLRLYGEGDAIGLEALLPAERPSVPVGVFAATKMLRGLTVPVDQFTQILEESPNDKAQALQALAERLQLLETLRYLAWGDRLCLVAGGLYLLADRCTPVGSAPKRLHVKNTDLAELLSIGLKTYADAAHELEMQGTIFSSRGTVTVLDMSKLRSVAVEGNPMVAAALGVQGGRKKVSRIP